MATPKTYHTQTCGDCDHWHEIQAPAVPAGPVLLHGPQEAVEKDGQCRAAPPSNISIQPPPQVTVLPDGRRHAQINVQIQSHYPTMRASCAACSLFCRRHAGD